MILRRYYYGWNIVAIAMFFNLVAAGVTFSSFGLFVLPVSKEFGLSRAEMNTGLILMNLGMAVLAPIVGRLLDKFPIRAIAVFCALLFGVGFAVIGFSHNLWLSAAMMLGPIAAGVLGAGSMTTAALVARWFKAHRGRAMALIAIGFSLGHMVAAPVVGMLIEAYGWRAALQIMAIGVPGLLLATMPLLRERPGDGDIESAAAASQSSDIPQRHGNVTAGPGSVSQLLRSPQLWSIGIAAGVGLGISQALLITIPPLGQDRGLSVVEVSGLLALAGVGAIAGKLTLSIVADKLDGTFFVIGLLLLGAVMNLAFLLSADQIVFMICATLVGLAAGALTPLAFALLADRFGATSFGTATGITMLIFSILGAAAARFSGEIYDRTGSYDLMFAVFVGVQLGGALLMFAFRKPRSTTSGDGRLTQSATV